MRSTSVLLSAETFGQVVGPLARAVGDRVARAVGVTEALAVRLSARLTLTPFSLRLLTDSTEQWRAIFRPPSMRRGKARRRR